MIEDIRYYYLHMGKGTITAYTERKREADGTIKFVRLGFSVCAPKDNFNKEKGRLIATGRAAKKPIYVPYTGNTYKDVEKYVKENTAQFPSWVQKHIATFHW